MARTTAGLFLALSALLLAPPWRRAAAQAAGARCPRVTVSCADIADIEGPTTFTVSLAGGVVTGKPTYSWIVSAGTITGGQGEPSLVVDTAELSNTVVEATVEVDGLPASCPRSASCATMVIRGCGGLPKIDEYGDIPFGDEQARLDNFAIELQNDPTSQGYIIAYGGRRGRAGEARRRADRARDYLVSTRGVFADRIVTVDGGFREDLTVELFIVTVGATAPVAGPTVEPAEVEIIPAEAGRKEPFSEK